MNFGSNFYFNQLIQMDAPYQNDPWIVYDTPILNRVYEYLGGEDLQSLSCTYLAACDGQDPRKIEKYPIEQLEALLKRGAPLARSLDDKTSVICHLDIEYVNFDDPTFAYTNPMEAYSKQQPVVRCIEEQLVSFGIQPLHLVTGQGHHFVWQISRTSKCINRLANLAFQNQPCQPTDRHEQIFHGLGLVMEFLANEIRNQATQESEIPVEVTAIHVGYTPSGKREMISLDISEYGDPLDSRMIRIPFTNYCKPWNSGLIDRCALGGKVAHFFTIPMHEMNIEQCIESRQDAAQIKKLSRQTSVTIPDQAKGMLNLISSYEISQLRSVHKRYYRDKIEFHRPLTLEGLPRCIHQALSQPNDLLLKPTMLQLVTRFLLSEQWQPREIADYITTIFRDNTFDWGEAWIDYDPAMRADFYIRVFSSLLATGNDPLIDFNCTSQQEKGYCWHEGNNCSLTQACETLSNQYNS